MRHITSLLLAGLLITSIAHAKPSVLIFAADNTHNLEAVKKILEKSGAFSRIDMTAYTARTRIPSLAQLRAYDALLSWNNTYSGKKPNLGNRLSEYHLEGRGIVTGLFLNTGWSTLIGNYSTKQLALFYCKDWRPANVKLGKTLNHELLTGVSSFDGGHQLYRCITRETKITPKTQIAAWYDTGDPLVLYRDDLPGRLVGLNFWPAPTPKGDWNPATDGGKMLVNALVWAAKKGNPFNPSKPDRNGPKPIYDSEF